MNTVRLRTFTVSQIVGFSADRARVHGHRGCYRWLPVGIAGQLNHQARITSSRWGNHREPFLVSSSEDVALTQNEFAVPEVTKLKEIVRLQVRLWEVAERLPEGLERQSVLREIRGFQNRMAALVRRLGPQQPVAA
jgi:hypothetical protein